MLDGLPRPLSWLVIKSKFESGYLCYPVCFNKRAQGQAQHLLLRAMEGSAWSPTEEGLLCGAVEADVVQGQSVI